MPTDRPDITVLMSVYNGAAFLREAVESVLNQTCRDFEIVIVDDGSTDGSPDILETCARRDGRIRTFRNETNLGLARSLNRGLAEARGEYIARLDADDAATPRRLEKQRRFLEANPAVGLIGSRWRVIDEQGQALGLEGPPLDDEAIRFAALFGNTFCHSAVMFRRRLVEEDNLVYNEQMRYSQDYELWVRMMEKNRVANLPEALVLLRRHRSQITATRTEEQDRAAARVSKKRIERFKPQWQPTEEAVGRLRTVFAEGLPPRPDDAEWEAFERIFDLLERGRQQGEWRDRACRRMKGVTLHRLLYRVASAQISRARRTAPLRSLPMGGAPWLACHRLRRLAGRLVSTGRMT